MGSLKSSKPHAVCVPYPAQGHVTPMMRLAKLLHSKGFHITFVNTEFNHERLIRSKGPESVKGSHTFRFETISDGMPPSDYGSTQDIPMLCDSIWKHCLHPFKELLGRLTNSSEFPPVSCVVADGVMSFGAQGAREMGIKDVQLWTASACAFMGYLHYREFIARGIVPFKDDSYQTNGTLDKTIDWIPGMKDIQYRDIPSFIRTTDADDIMLNYLGEEAQSCLFTSAIIFNTFDALEQEVLDAFVEKFKYENIYTIGPLPLLERHLPRSQSEVNSFSASLWKPNSDVFDWLDKRELESVVYVNYGSITTMSLEHFNEFAWGLANSKHPFLWILRSDVTLDGSVNFPEGFLEEIKDRGLIASWVTQEEVLAHESVGAFLTHCGWNSTSESIAEGKPTICWPFFADQQTNCGYLCKYWEMGLEVNKDVKRGEVEGLIRKMMEENEGKKMRMKAKEWKKKAIEATDFGGSSYQNFIKVVEKVLLEN